MFPLIRNGKGFFIKKNVKVYFISIYVLYLCTRNKKNIMTITINNKKGVLIKKDRNYGLFKFEKGQFVFNINSINKKETL